VLAAAKREFREESGVDVGIEDLTALEPVKNNRKTLYAFVMNGAHMDASAMKSNTCETVWPPKSEKL